MKKIVLTFIALSLLLVTPSCKKDLPYMIDEVTRGVLIDVIRVADSEPVMYGGITTGNYKIKLTIPPEQGDYSFMSHAQLLAVLQGVDGKTTSAVVMDNITQFPLEIPINVADVFGKFGLSAPISGQILFFTANVVKKDGLVIPGWSSYTGFNNVDFAGWQVDGRNYSSNVRYAVVCAFNIDDFVGTMTVTRDDWWGEEPYPVEVTKISDTELSISGLCDGVCSNDLIIKVNRADFTLTIARQILEPNSGYWWNPSAGRPDYNDFSLEGSGVIDACKTSITFTATARVIAGSFGPMTFVIVK